MAISNERAAQLIAENEGNRRLLAEYQAAERNRTLHEMTEVAAHRAGITDAGAIADLKLRAERDLEIEGSTLRVKATLQPVENWLQDMKPKAAHLWQASQAQQAKPLPYPDNPWTAANWNITKQGEVVLALGISRAAELAKQAGSKIGATKPTQ